MTTPQDFVNQAERVLANTSPGGYPGERRRYIADARSKFGSGIAQEVADALPDTVEQFQQIVSPPGNIKIPGFTMTFIS